MVLKDAEHHHPDGSATRSQAREAIDYLNKPGRKKLVCLQFYLFRPFSVNI